MNAVRYAVLVSRSGPEMPWGLPGPEPTGDVTGACVIRTTDFGRTWEVYGAPSRRAGADLLADATMMADALNAETGRQADIERLREAVEG